LSVSHVVYGLRVRANIALPGLPLGLDPNEYDVRIHLKDWDSFPTTFSESVGILYTSSQDFASDQPSLRVGVLPGGDYFGFFYSDEVRFAVERRGREIWGDWPENYTFEDACTYLLGPVIGFVLRLRGITCLHASAVAIDKRAIALVGFPGAGKSTTAAAFAQRGFPVIADDVVALAEVGENFLVPPGYPRVNLWPDSVRALLGSEGALPQITPTWEKRYMALDENGLGFASKPLSLGVIYLLDKREPRLAAPVFEEIAGGDAVAALVAHTYVNYLLDRDMRSAEFDVLSRIVARIPIRRVRPTADPAAVFDLCEVIASDAKRVMVPNPPSATSWHSQSYV
jgi:hypothetical protein